MGRSTPAFRVLFAFGSTKKISRPGRNAPTVRPSQIPALEKSRPRKEEAPGKPGLPHRWGYGAVRPRPHQLAVLGLCPSPLLFLASQSAQVSRRETGKCALTPFGIQRQLQPTLKKQLCKHRANHDIKYPRNANHIKEKRHG